MLAAATQATTNHKPRGDSDRCGRNVTCNMMSSAGWDPAEG